MDKRAHLPNLFESSVDVLISDRSHVGRSHAWGAGHALTAMQKHSAAADVLAHGFENGAKLPYGNRLGVLDVQVKIADAPALALDRNLRQRNHRRDAMRVASRKFLGVGETAEKEALPNLSHSAPSSSIRGSFRRFIPTFAAIHAGISGRFSCLTTMLRPLSQSISTY